MEIKGLERRAIFFLNLQTKYNLSQKQIILYCEKKFDYHFSQSTISQSLKIGRLISEIEEKEKLIQDKLPKIDEELVKSLFHKEPFSCIAKFR